ncbi:hypothetical protein DFJ74DRAFT_695741 [Hyaloraphidium curvatum]|nr:hypothetical protein DFJ74DRAFT_695741 [Hyaloraphidium curvatum]
MAPRALFLLLALLALLLLPAAPALASPVPLERQPHAVFKRTCYECAASEYCEYGYPGSPPGRVACVDLGIGR